MYLREYFLISNGLSGELLKPELNALGEQVVQCLVGQGEEGD